MSTKEWLQPGGYGQKSFYKKAFVETDDNGDVTLYSYNTPIITIGQGWLIKHWGGWSQTTGNHIYAFCRLNKRAYEQMPCDVSIPCTFDNGKVVPQCFAIIITEQDGTRKYYKGQTESGRVSRTTDYYKAKIYFDGVTLQNDYESIIDTIKVEKNPPLVEYTEVTNLLRW